MHPRKGGLKAFIILGQATETDRPGDAAFDHPPTRKQDEAFLRRRKFDHFQLNVVVLCRFRRLLARVAL